VWGGFSSRQSVSGAPYPGTLGNNQFAATWILSNFDAYDFYDEPTILRIIHRLTVYARVPTGFSNANNWAVEVRAGIVVTRPDIANPNEPAAVDIQNLSEQWLWYQTYQLYHLAGDVISIIAIDAGGGPQNGAMDIRAKRKIPEGFGLAYVIANMDESTISGGATLMDIAYAAQGRFLMADH